MSEVEIPKISVVDGRYRELVGDFRKLATDENYYSTRVQIEIAWLICVMEHISVSTDEIWKNYKYDDLEQTICDLKQWLSSSHNTSEMYKNIRMIEKKTRHDVKAIEYYIREFVQVKYHNLIHICLTSQDINSVAFTIILKKQCDYMVNKLEKFVSDISFMKDFNVPYMQRTHGQKAVGGCLGRFIEKFIIKIKSEIPKLVQAKNSLTSKFSSSTGDYSTLLLGFGTIDVIHSKQKRMCELLNVDIIFNDDARQIDDYTSYVELAQVYMMISMKIQEFCTQIWLMIRSDNLVQKKIDGEIGSSVMPQKINPWSLEQSWAIFSEIVSGLQNVSKCLSSSFDARDMSDSVTMRFFQDKIALLVIAITNITDTFKIIQPNVEFCEYEVVSYPASKGELLQTYLRIMNYQGDPYKECADFLKGRKVTGEQWNCFVDSYECLTSEQKKKIYSYES